MARIRMTHRFAVFELYAKGRTFLFELAGGGEKANGKIFRLIIQMIKI